MNSKDIVVLPADKGNATVVMKSSEYHNKLDDMLSSGTYGIVKKDPTSSQVSKICRILKKLKDKKEMDQRLYNKLRPCGSKSPMIYGLPKIHKKEVPLRSIVSCIQSPSYLSKYIASIISPLAGKTGSFVKNSGHFLEMIKTEYIKEDEIMVSFDVVSLFTNVPIQESIQIIQLLLQRDEELENRTELSVERVSNLLELCLSSRYFCYRGFFYTQKEGAAMGSPVSPIIANLYMEFFEEMALNSTVCRPRIWKRYVDDVFCIIKKGKEDELLKNLNSHRSNFQFTMEKEVNGSLSFLDCNLNKKEDTFLEVSIHRKPTHTDRYLNFRSHHPAQVKRGIVKCLFDRARRLISDERNLRKEEDYLEEVFRGNDYPKNFIKNYSQRSKSFVNDQNIEEELRKKRKEPFIVIPYIMGVSEELRRVCGKYGVRVTFKSGTSLRGSLTKVKDEVSIVTKSKFNVVYSIACDCGKCYIGETERTLQKRLKEYKDAFIGEMVGRSAVADHAWSDTTE